MSLLAAPSNFGDWIEILIVMLVLGGSALGAIGKKLIKAFSPKESEQSVEKIPSAPRRIEPSLPTARPLRPQKTTPPVPQGRVFGRPVATARPVAERPRDIRPRPAEFPDFVETLPPVPPQAPIPTPSSAPPPPVEAYQPQPPQHAAQGPRPKKQKSRRKRKRPSQPGVGETLSLLGLRETPGDMDPHAKLAHLQHAIKDVPDEMIAPDPFDVIRQPTRMALRQAILMNEILGPPLALREERSESPI